MMGKGAIEIHINTINKIIIVIILACVYELYLIYKETHKEY